MKLAFVAGMIGFALLGVALGVTALGQAAFIVSGLFGVAAIVAWVAGMKRPTDPYSLALLKQIEERKKDEIDEEELDAYDASGNVVCLNCGSEYDPRLGFCPRCKKSQF